MGVSIFAEVWVVEVEGGKICAYRIADIDA